MIDAAEGCFFFTIMIEKTYTFKTASLDDPNAKAQTEIRITLKGSRNGEDYEEHKDELFKLSIVGVYRDTCRNYCGGQVSEILAALPVMECDKELQQDILTLWKEHLNDIHAGTREQEQCVDENLQNYDYEKACKILKEKGLYEVMVNGKPYKYGYGWLYYKLSDTAISLLRKLELINEE